MPRKKLKKKKIVYFFGGGKAEGSAVMRELLGGKGAGLHEMTRIGAPVPPGFTITTDVCTYFYDHRRQYPKGLEAEVAAALARVEKILGRKFGDAENPLLDSVRSGARESMPGMMDTILNLGLNDKTVEGLAKRTSNPRFAYDCYRRFIQMYGDVVMGVQAANQESHNPFDVVMDGLKHELRKREDTELTADDLKELVKRYKKLIRSRKRADFPQGVYEQ